MSVRRLPSAFFTALAPRHPAGMLLAGMLTAVLAGCGSSPPANISLSTTRAAAEASTGDLQVEEVDWTRSKPGCSGECPRIHVKSVAFPGIPKLTALVDHVLAYMTGLNGNRPRPYETLNEYAQYFWQTAQARDETWFQAKVKDAVGDIVAVELQTGQYMTGAAHPIPATQYLNWQRSKERVLALDEAIIPGRQAQFTAALKAAHASWLEKNEDAQRDPAAYNRLWPFVPTDNFALTQQGLTVKYGAYTIAPYAYGEPELQIPYDKLVGILRPEFIASKS